MTDLLHLAADGIGRALVNVAVGFSQADKRVYIPYMMGALVLATGVWAMRLRGRQSLLAFVLPKAIWLHRSARFDYKFLLTRSLLDLTLLAPASVSVAAVAIGT